MRKETNGHQETQRDPIKRIEELERLVGQLLGEKEQEVLLNFPWTGNLGHWYWDIAENHVTCNPMKVMALGYEREEVPDTIPYSFFTERLHPDDYEKTMQAMRDHLAGKSAVYEVEYRIKTRDGKWKWFYDRGKITLRTPEGQPVFLSGIVFDITSQKEMEELLADQNRRLEEISRHDGLTGLLNHRAFVELLGERIRESGEKPLAIAIFDIDDFKRINDTYGHIAGDGVLQRVAELLSRCVRKTDFTGRYGGEEFIAAFCDTPGESALIAAEKFRRQVETFAFENGIHITISGGVCAYAGQPMRDLMKEADDRMYDAKHKGKNRIVF